MDATVILDDSSAEMPLIDLNISESEFPDETIEELLERARSTAAAATNQMNKARTVPLRSVNMRATTEMEAAFAATIPVAAIPTSSRDMNESLDDVIFVGIDHVATGPVINLCSPDRGPTSSRLNIAKNRTRMDELKTQAAASSDPPKDNQRDDLGNTVICAVCMESAVGQQPHSTNCGHIFCGACIKESIKIRKKCPLCNKSLTVKNIFPVFI